MDKTNNNINEHLQDEDLSAALASFRRTPASEADFESRFLADFHQRLAAEESVKQPSLMARLGAFLSSCWQSKLVWGTSFAGICVLCVASLSLIPGADDGIAHSGSEKNMVASSDVVSANGAAGGNRVMASQDSLSQPKDAAQPASAQPKDAKDAPAQPAAAQGSK